MKIIKWISGVLITVLVLISGICYFLLVNSVAPYDGEVEISRISHNVEITFDTKGIPQVWAQSEKDAWFALGWLHASERLFQMDLTRRIARGRLSELLGDSTLEMDMESRRIGHARMAEEQIGNLSTENRERLESYVSGVNTFVEKTGSIPFEFYLLRYDFEPWTVSDCLTVLSFQTWYSNALMSQDKFFLEIASKYGLEKAKSALPEYPKWAPYTVPQNPVSSLISEYKKQLSQSIISQNKVPFLMSESSNSWVVSPLKSASGHAILASDPHLEITRLPQFWYYVGIHIEKGNREALGISAAGLPLVAMGHNGIAAWAFTAGGVDVIEYYEEKINPDDSTEYLTPAGWRPFEIITEQIVVAGRENPYPLEIRKTIHGPVFYESDNPKKIYAIDWAGFDNDLNAMVDASFDLIASKTFEAFRTTVTQFGALNANWTYADKNGNIGYQLGTPVPVRGKNRPNLPVNGWENNRVWDGYLELGQTAFSYNPERGWLATANNKQRASGDNVDIPGDYASDRILRLDQLLGSKDLFASQDFMDMQMDRIDASLMRWAVRLAAPLKESGTDGIDLVKKLETWNGYTGIDSRETAFLRNFIQVFKKNVANDELGDLYMGVKDDWLQALFDTDESEWYDNVLTVDVKETRDDILNKSIAETIALTRGKTLGDFQTFTMAHPFAFVPLLGDLLYLRFGPWPWPGTKGTLNSSFSNYRDGKYNVVVGPSWRFVIDFANPDGIEMVLPAGNSGNPMSPHFSDFLESWKEGKYWTVPFSKDKVYEAAESILVLKKN